MSVNNAQDVEAEVEAIEIQEWLDSLDYVLQNGGAQRVKRLFQHLQVHAQKAGVELPFSANTPYINTIPVDKQPPFPGVEKSNGGLKAWYAGTPWPWWYARTVPIAIPGGIFRHTPPRQPSMKWH